MCPTSASNEKHAHKGFTSNPVPVVEEAGVQCTPYRHSCHRHYQNCSIRRFKEGNLCESVESVDKVSSLFAWFAVKGR
jgi:hypothetical protein